MEFNVFEHFKGYQRTTQGPMTAEEQGTRFFLAGHMGERIGERVDTCAARSGLSRRNFIGTASGFAAAMLAVNQITGMKFFEVSESEAYDLAAAQEVKDLRIDRIDRHSDGSYEVIDWDTASIADRARYGRFFHAMLARGISLAPSQFEANFISGAHTADDIAETVTAVAESLEAVR